MMIVRPVRASDHSQILALAQEAGIGMTSLPADSDVLAKKIDRAAESFTGGAGMRGHERFLFALEDTDAKKLAGTTGVAAHVGLKNPFYSYKLSTIVQASKSTGIYSQQRVLHMVNDYTGATEIGSLFLSANYRRDGIGRFLSRCRYLLMAEFPDVFSEVVISEIRGVQGADGGSPFYDHLAKHFFQMDFQQADFIHATQGGQFISDLMPKYPIYVNLLAKEAQDVIGVPLEASKGAIALLEAEGFRYQGYIDVFDAGPTVQVSRDQIRTVRKSRRAEVMQIKAVGGHFMVANTRLADFTIALAGLEEVEGGVAIDEKTAQNLNIKIGDAVRFIEA